MKTFEDMVAKQFGLNSQESAAIHAAGQTLKPVLARNRHTAQSIVGNKKAVSTVDTDALASLDKDREQTITTLTNQILNSVRSDTAARLRAAGSSVASATTKR